MTIKVKLTRACNYDYYNKSKDDIIQLDLQTYLIGVVASQIGNASLQACMAQAIACRTSAYPYFSKNKQISDSSSKVQCFTAQRAYSNSYQTVRDAVKQTQGMLLAYNGTPCSPCSYCHSNGGHTKSSKQVWGGQRAWLISQTDPYDNGSVSGHCVGMSQTGAKAMAKQGMSYKQILKFYYPNTNIITINGGEQSVDTVSVEKYVQQAKYIRDHFTVDYKWSTAGTKYTYKQDIMPDGTPKFTYHYWCDCRGYAIIWILKRCGLSVSCPGTNYSIRNQMRTLHKVSKASELIVGQVVYKIRKPGDPKYDLPSQYKLGKSGYNAQLGELDSYHIGTVISVNPLKIYHCSSGGIRVDTTLGQWSYAGFLKQVVSESPTVTKQPQTTTQMKLIGTVIGGALNLRKTPSTSANRVTQIPNGKNVTVLKTDCGAEGWYFVSYGKFSGYVMSKYLSFG